MIDRALEKEFPDSEGDQGGGGLAGGGDILEKHGLKSVFAFDAASRARGVAIHSTPRNGYSLLPYAANSTIFLDGEPNALMWIKTATDGLLETLSSVLELSAAKKVGIGLALSDSDNSGMKLKGKH
ncbi:hypothetical protein D1007_07367 [Hordeum vulgare]|nr:hypothetical protein D1007_07367 [Hordeum vulgare]